MPALMPTRFSATVSWLGRVPDRAASLRAEPLIEVMLGFAGVAGEAHGGEYRPACGRVSDQHPEATIIRNVRQLSVLSAEELEMIAAQLGLAVIDPSWLGASMVLTGLPDLTHLPPSSRLQAPSGATLVVDMENRPCNFPAKEIEKEAPGHGKPFRAAAAGRRGVTAWVEREGVICLGDRLTLHIPDQPVWSQLTLARHGAVPDEERA